jgi:hypothetical protein
MTEPTVNTKKILAPFSLAAMSVAVVSSVGIGIKDESMPLRKSPNSPYLVKKSVTEGGKMDRAGNVTMDNQYLKMLLIVDNVSTINVSFILKISLFLSLSGGD